jgi:hypothetical protein
MPGKVNAVHRKSKLGGLYGCGCKAACPVNVYQCRQPAACYQCLSVQAANVYQCRQPAACDSEQRLVTIGLRLCMYTWIHTYIHV